MPPLENDYTGVDPSATAFAAYPTYRRFGVDLPSLQPRWPPEYPRDTGITQAPR